ncbi:hypothetical protein JCM19231_1805 [Vibrio ishigakensis]|uniref:Uncharacterized protein n=1 Tax=Vibrio ishigakensis TaxID=1481914 RepID=A0A0B8P808_9VIBR|nr:hypothetical protein JCM19231_1805 [Vibrio ishigakensis]
MENRSLARFHSGQGDPLSRLAYAGHEAVGQHKFRDLETLDVLGMPKA